MPKSCQSSRQIENISPLASNISLALIPYRPYSLLSNAQTLNHPPAQRRAI